MNALEEIWKQNSLTTASDCQAIVKTILREDALTAFEASIDEDLEPDEDADARTPEKGLTPTMIDDALISVARNIFPHRERRFGCVDKSANLKTCLSANWLRLLQR
jgi:hypothetical protein